MSGASISPPWFVTSADDVQIAVHELGGRGDTMLMAHATGFCAGPYRPLAAELADRHRLVALDFRGHGDSGRPASGRFDWWGMAADVLAVVAALGDAPIHAFGHSMGGAAILLAEQAMPGTFRSTFLYEPVVLPEPPVEPFENTLAGSASARRPTFPTRADALYRYASRPPLNQFRADALWGYVESGFAAQPDGSVRLKCAPEDEAATFQAARVTAADIEGAAMPCLVAVGYDEPAPNPGAFGPTLAGILPSGSLLRFDGLGHFGPFQDPPAVAAAVREHLEQLDRLARD